jgi:hypothetical protein
VAAAAALLLGALAAGCPPKGAPRGPGAPADAIRAYLRAVEARDVKAAYQALGPTLRARISESDFARMMREDYDLIRAEAESLRTYLETPLPVEAALTAEGGEVRLVYEDGRWRLCGDILEPPPADSPAKALKALARALERRDPKALERLLTDEARARASSFVDRLGAALTAASERVFTETSDEVRLKVDRGWTVVLKRKHGIWRVERLLRPSGEGFIPTE